MSVKKRVEIIRKLELEFPDPKSELDFCSDYQLVVAVLLSAQCTDRKVNQVTPLLFEKYIGFKDLANADLDDVENIIRPINYYRTKSKHLIAMAQSVESEWGGVLPRNFADLTKLSGVGRKTANVVLGELGVSATFPVDTHVFRVARRLGFTSATNRDQVELDLMKLFPPNTWRSLHHRLILHGRRSCKAQRPLCAMCVLRVECPSAEKEMAR